MKTECGLIGTFINNPITKKDLWNTLAEIQHRGQDSYGFVSIHSNNSNETGFEAKIIKEKGLLPDIDSLNLYGSDGSDGGSDGSDGGSDGSDGGSGGSDGCSDGRDGCSDGRGMLFLGHMRYSTNTTVENLDESFTECNIQPVEISKEYGIYIAHNGNLPNLKDNMRRLGLEQYYKNGMSDTYLFKVIWNIKFAGKFKQENKTCKLEDILEYLKYIVLNVVGAYSCVMTFCESSIGLLASTTRTNNDVSNNKHKYYLLGFRDRYGYKPLSIGELVSDSPDSKKSQSRINYCFFSESVQLQDNKYFIRDVAPGEIWYSEMNNEPKLLGRINYKTNNDMGFLCSLEAIYFMKKDTLLFNGNTTVNIFRQRLGIELGTQDINNLACALKSENTINPNEYIYEYVATRILKKRVILYMPESAYGIAQGYSDILGTCVRNDLIFKVQNIRSFIENTTEAREGKLKRKFAFNDEGIAALGSAEIVLIDDTIVRGNSMRYVIGELYKRNPELKIHVRIGSPRLIKGCSFGIDLYDDELIAAKEPDLAKWLGIASVEFLDISILKEIFAKYGMMNCQHCFGVSNKYNTKTLEW